MTSFILNTWLRPLSQQAQRANKTYNIKKDQMPNKEQMNCISNTLFQLKIISLYSNHLVQSKCTQILCVTTHTISLKLKGQLHHSNTASIPTHQSFHYRKLPHTPVPDHLWSHTLPPNLNVGREEHWAYIKSVNAHYLFRFCSEKPLWSPSD